jgi:hypothetical protein
VSSTDLSHLLPQILNNSGRVNYVKELYNKSLVVSMDRTTGLYTWLFC